MSSRDDAADRYGPADAVSVAPMMDRTDAHCRYFLRLLNPGARLYTEMVVDQAILNSDPERLLAFDPVEHPVALQLGGSDPATLAAAVRRARTFDYDELNLNIGCPSDRVQSGRFGACLMAEPQRVGDCVAAMAAETTVPVTVKTRIGIDDRDDYAFLEDFVAAVAAAGCRRFVVHARKAILEGLSPKENRSIPPLRYETVYRLKRDRPDLTIVLNGGIGSVADVHRHLAQVDQVMIGRKAYAEPYLLAELYAQSDEAVGRPPIDRFDVVRQMADYAERQLRKGVRLHHITRHMLGLFAGRPAARRWRRYITEQGRQPDAGPQVLIESLGIFAAAA